MATELTQQQTPRFEQLQELMALCHEEREQVAHIWREIDKLKAIRKRVRQFLKGADGRNSTSLPWTGHFCWEKLVAVVIIASLSPALASTNGPPMPPPVTATNNIVSVVPTFTVPLVWTYILNPTSDIPNMTVVQYRTNTASVFSASQPAYVGTNRMTLNLPAGDWRIDVFGETGAAVSGSATIFGTAADGIEVVVSDFAKTTNRVVYSGPPMPDTNGFMRAWNTHKFTQK